MNTPIPPELFAQRPVRSELPGRETKPVLRIRRLVALLAVLAAFIGAGFAVSVLLNSSDSTEEEIPHIQAEYPIKTRPENPGGIDIPHRNVEIFERLEDKRGDGTVAATSAVEHLLPAPEAPQPVEQEIPANTPATEQAQDIMPLATPKEESSSSPPSSVESPAEKLPPSTPQKTETIAKPAAPVDTPPPAPPLVEKKVEKPKEPAPVPAAPKKEAAPASVARLPETLFTQTPPATGTAAHAIPDVSAPPSAAEKPSMATEGRTARVQFASLPDESAAKRDVAVLASRFASALAGTSLEVVRADIPGKGIYHRIVTTPVPEATAKKICADVKTAKGSCLLLK